MRSRFHTQYLTAADIRKIEEAMNQEDAEVMVAVVDRIVKLRLKAAQANASTKAEVADKTDGVK